MCARVPYLPTQLSRVPSPSLSLSLGAAKQLGNELYTPYSTLYSWLGWPLPGPAPGRENAPNSRVVVEPLYTMERSPQKGVWGLKEGKSAPYIGLGDVLLEGKKARACSEPRAKGNKRLMQELLSKVNCNFMCGGQIRGVSSQSPLHSRPILVKDAFWKTKAAVAAAAAMSLLWLLPLTELQEREDDRDSFLDARKKLSFVPWPP